MLQDPQIVLSSQSADGINPWIFVAALGAALGFFLILAILALWFKDRKNRRLHEEQMLAMQRGLDPPEWSGQSARASFRRAWLGLAVGLPIFIAFALALGTHMLVDAAGRSLRDFTHIIVLIWLVGGAVGLTAVIMGGLGLMANQRRHYRQASNREMPQVPPAPPVRFEDRAPAPEKFKKQEGP